MFRVGFELVYILWIATHHRWRMTWWQFSNHALYPGLSNEFLLEPCVPVACICVLPFVAISLAWF
jgi:hypothetical protein